MAFDAEVAFCMRRWIPNGWAEAFAGGGSEVLRTSFGVM
jgi:hypothetical protein